jgi:pseudouridine-5'-phosphate glycosidase
MLRLSPEVEAGVHDGRPVVALESTLIAHGLPWPANIETARQAQAAVRQAGAVPATIAVWQGRPTAGLDDDQLEHLARCGDIRKASRRDLAAAVADGATAATTVAATMALAHLAGIRVFATGGIGGVHPRSPDEPLDVSADLHELARTAVAVVCAGAKSILDLPATLEVLEALGVPVVGFGTDTFPAFFATSSGLPVGARVDDPRRVAALLRAHWQLGGGGAVVAQPVSPEEALDPAALAEAIERAEAEALREGVRGSSRTPFLLRRLADITGGRTLRANRSLVVANARLAARIAVALDAGG